MKKASTKKATVKKVSATPESAASFQQLSDAFKADIQKAHEANDLNAVVARSNQFVTDAQGLFQ